MLTHRAGDARRRADEGRVGRAVGVHPGLASREGPRGTVFAGAGPDLGRKGPARTLGAGGRPGPRELPRLALVAVGQPPAAGETRRAVRALDGAHVLAPRVEALAAVEALVVHRRRSVAAQRAGAAAQGRGVHELPSGADLADLTVGRRELANVALAAPGHAGELGDFPPLTLRAGPGPGGQCGVGELSRLARHTLLVAVQVLPPLAVTRGASTNAHTKSVVRGVSV
jgi:hypothetical protein